MKQTGRNILLFLLLIGIISCSIKKNTFTSRTYHNVTAHYNVYFNGKESYKAGNIRIAQAIPDDYTHPLPIFKNSLPEAAKIAASDMDFAIAKCQKLIALHSITKSPERKPNNSEYYKKFASKGEYNEWVDKAYVLMGMANYCKHDYRLAIENFNYVVRKFSDRPSRFDALLGMARSYIETGDYPPALEIFAALARDASFPKSLVPTFNLVQAQYQLKINEPKGAIPFLQTALSMPLSRAEKLRASYILAQLLTLTKQPEEALKQYQKVLKMHPPYQMTFNARISRMELIGAENKVIEKQLAKMLKAAKNKEYRDRIYYTMANIAVREGRIKEGIEDLKNSVRYSVSNKQQRAISSLDVARIFYEQNEYLQSACYYDSAVAVIDVNYPGYAEILTRSATLNKLAKSLHTIQREDSLQQLALMSEKDRNTLIDLKIKALQKEEAKKLADANADQQNQNYFRSEQFRQQGTPTSDNQNLWYFYNPLTIGIGKSDFQKIWGKRALEDNWRRKNKLSNLDVAAEQAVDSAAQTAIPNAKKKVSDPKTAAYYLQDIPLTDSLMSESIEQVKSAMFNAAHLYRTELNDSPRAIAMLKDLNLRFKGCLYELPAYFELYQLYKEGGDVANSEAYKEKITLEYPNSKYAKYLNNPNYFVELKKKNTSVEVEYATSLKQFFAFDFPSAASSALQIIPHLPDSMLLPKVKFIAIVAKGASQERKEFASNLEQYIKDFPKTPTADIAIQIKTLIASNALADYKQLLAKGYIKEQLANDELKNKTNTTGDEFGGKYSYDQNLFHYYVIAFPKDSKVEVNRLIYDIANYNLDYYTSSDFDIEALSLDDKTQLVVVRNFPDKEEGQIYFKSIIRKRAVFASLKGLEYVNFMISSSNYRVVTNDKDYHSYLPFFIKNYSTYINSDVPKEILPNPEDLLAKIRKEDDPTNNGKFVVVQSAQVKDTVATIVPEPKAIYQGLYREKAGDSYCFALVFLKKQLEDAKLIQAVKLFNQTNYGAPSIQVSSEVLDANRGLLVVQGLGKRSVAEAYFKRWSTNQAMQDLLKGSNFRTMLISVDNLSIFRKEKNVLSYMEFYNQLK